MIFIDSNIPMYLVGADHPNKTRTRQILEQAVFEDQRLVTDAEVMQEILHRYGSIGSADAIEPAFAALIGLVDEVFPIDHIDVLAAHRIMQGFGLSARDAIHVTVMERYQIDRMMSFDAGFDAYPGMVRLS